MTRDYIIVEVSIDGSTYAYFESEEHFSLTDKERASELTPISPDDLDNECAIPNGHYVAFRLVNDLVVKGADK